MAMVTFILLVISLFILLFFCIIVETVESDYCRMDFMPNTIYTESRLSFRCVRR